jgi:hypothetical protein
VKLRAHFCAGAARRQALRVNFAGHSQRRGFITNAAKKKALESIKRVTGQRSSGVVLEVAASTLDDEPPLLEVVGGFRTAN